MQVVYSGGSTPTPSPRLQRKQYGGYGRPVLPGYVLGPPPSATVHRSPTKEKPPPSAPVEDDSSLRDSIPVMSKPLAIACLICNVILPGLGTFISGISVLCCSRARLKDHSKCRVVLVNAWVALLQFITAFLFLLGWIWSIMWGAAFMSVSDKHYKKVTKEHDKKAPDKPKETVPIEQEEATKIDYSPHWEQNGSPVAGPTQGPPQPPLHPPTTSTIPSIPGSASDSQIGQPMIVLQEIPVINQSESIISPSRPILNARTRHQKILRRQMSDNELSPFNLTQEQLEEIVIHAAPVSRGRLARDDSLNSEPTAGSSIPVAEK